MLFRSSRIENDSTMREVPARATIPRSAMRSTARVPQVEQEPTALAYPDLLVMSARSYADSLRANRDALSNAGRAACDRLLATLESALETLTELRPEHLAFGARSLDDITTEDRGSFVNQFVLGTGWDGAPILVMGTEAAENYAAANAEELEIGRASCRERV